MSAKKIGNGTNAAATDATIDKSRLASSAAAMLRGELDVNDMEADTSTGDPNAPFMCLAYGEAGVGKSTMFSQAEGVYFIPTEQGVSQIQVPRYKRPIETLSTLVAILEKLLTGRHPYKAVCLDSATAAERLIVAHIDAELKKNPVKLKDGSMAHSISDMNAEYGRGYTLIVSKWLELLKIFEALREKRGMNVFITANCKTETVRNIEGPDYQKYTMDLSGPKSIKLLVNASDFTLFMRQDVSIDARNKKKVLADARDLSIYTRGTAAWTAKTRGAIPWPERIPLDWATFDRLRLLIAHHGRELRQTLVDRFAAIEATIPGGDATTKPEESPRARAKAVFYNNLNAGQWHMADAVCLQAEEEAAVGAPKAETHEEIDLGVDEQGEVIRDFHRR